MTKTVQNDLRYH